MNLQCTNISSNKSNSIDKWKAPSWAEELDNPLKGNLESVNAGKILYNRECTMCHGVRGKGDGVGSTALSIAPADLTAEEEKEEPDGVPFWKISEGRSPMPAFKNKLTSTERWQLVNYVRTLK